MYDNIGKKIKGLAKWTAIVEMISCFIAGIVMIIEDDDLILIALPIILFGPIIAWVSSWLIYGFGELIDKTCDIENHTRNIERNTRGNRAPMSNVQSTIEDERLKKLEQLRRDGLITEEEYRNALSK